MQIKSEKISIEKIKIFNKLKTDNSYYLGRS